MPPKLPEEYSDFRKDQILNAAWDCFVEKGYSETTMREISKRINSSTGVIYNYFKGKDEILDAIQESSLEQYRQAFDQIDKNSTAREAIMEFLNSRLECCPVDVMKKSARGNIGLWSEAMKRQNIRNLFISHHVLMRENLSRFIREGIENGEIQTGSIEPIPDSGKPVPGPWQSYPFLHSQASYAFKGVSANRRYTPICPNARSGRSSRCCGKTNVIPGRTNSNAHYRD